MGIKEDPKSPGTFIVSYSKRHPITRQPHNLRRIGISSRAEANRVQADLIVRVNEKIKQVLMPTWPKLIDEFLANDIDLGEKTKQNYEFNLKAHTLNDWGNRYADQITALDIKNLVKGKLGNKSAGTQQSNLKFIRKVFSYAVEKGILRHNPTPHLKFKLGDKAKKVLTEEQVRRLLENAKLHDQEWYFHWALASYTGMRSGELYALKWDRVNLETQQIVVNESWNNKDGFKSTKSGHDRIIPIAPTLITILQELKLQSGGSAFVLPRMAKWDKGEQARELQKFLIGLELPAIRFHDLRASWATILLGKGLAPVLVMKMGGWRDLKTLMIYLRMAGIDTRHALDDLVLHDPSKSGAKVLNFEPRSSS